MTALLRRVQSRASSIEGRSGLPVSSGSILSPYQLRRTREDGEMGRLIQCSQALVSPLGRNSHKATSVMKVILQQFNPDTVSSPVDWYAAVTFVEDDGSYVADTALVIDVSSHPRTNSGLHAAIVDAVLAYATLNSYTITAEDVITPFSGGGVTAYLNGEVQEGTVPYVATGLVAGGSGVARLYLTDNGAANGNAIFSEVLADSIQPVVFGGNANLYSFGTPTVSGDNKYVDLPVYRQNFTGIVLLSTNILGSVALGAAPNDTAVKLVVLGRK